MDARPEREQPLVLFDTRELYFLTQFVPVYRALERRGVACGFVAYRNRPARLAEIQAAFERDALPVEWVDTKADGLELYRRRAPDWVFFGRGYAHHAELAPVTRSAMLFHGIGMKLSKYAPELVALDVRFVEGPYAERQLRARYPEARLEVVGHAKLDPAFGPAEAVPRFDLAAHGLDPARPTLLYAPSHTTTSFPHMGREWPREFADVNLLVKPHYLSHFGRRRESHRRLMDHWCAFPNVHVAPIEAWDPLPFMVTADLLISDLSAMAFEFAALDKPIVWNDFVDIPWTRRGLLGYRLWRRMDRAIVEQFGDVAAHARRYADLGPVVRDELADPQRLALARARCRRELVGPTDGRVGERIADHVLAARHSGVASS